MDAAIVGAGSCTRRGRAGPRYRACPFAVLVAGRTRVGFFADGKLKTADVDTGDVRSVCDAASDGRRLECGRRDPVRSECRRAAVSRARSWRTPRPVTCVDAPQSSRVTTCPSLRRWTAFPVLHYAKRARDTLQTDCSQARSTRGCNLYCCRDSRQRALAVMRCSLCGPSLLARPLDQQSMQLRGETVSSHRTFGVCRSLLLCMASRFQYGVDRIPVVDRFACRLRGGCTGSQRTSFRPCFRDPAISPTARDWLFI